MSLVFPLIEKAPNKELGFTDLHSRGVQIAQRRYDWLSEHFNRHSEWWTDLTHVKRDASNPISSLVQRLLLI
eukprot:gene4973-22826_t